MWFTDQSSATSTIGEGIVCINLNRNSYKYGVRAYRITYEFLVQMICIYSRMTKMEIYTCEVYFIFVFFLVVAAGHLEHATYLVESLRYFGEVLCDFTFTSSCRASGRWNIFRRRPPLLCPRKTGYLPQGSPFCQVELG